MSKFREATLGGIQKITTFESLRLRAYDDLQPKRTAFSSVAQVKGTPTIGYGHIKSVTKADVVNGRRITKEQALAFKQADLRDTYAKIEAVLGRSAVDALSDNQYDALVSFAYNAGLSPRWKIAKLIKAKRYAEVPSELRRFVYSKGVRLQGLVNRRRVEIDMWLAEETENIDAVALHSAPVECAPAASVTKSRTFKASMLAGLSTVGTAATAAIAQLSPFANEGVLKTILVVLVSLATVASFAAAFFRAQDAQGEGV